MLAYRRLGREHDGVRAVEHGVGDIGRLGPGRPLLADHALQHLGGGDRGNAETTGGAENLLLQDRHLLGRRLGAQVAARHHHHVRGQQHLDERLGLNRLGLLELGDHRHRGLAGGHVGPQQIEVLGASDERQRQGVDPGGQGGGGAGAVVLGEGGQRGLAVGQVDAHAAAHVARSFDHGDHPRRSQHAHAQHHLAVLDQDAASGRAVATGVESLDRDGGETPGRRTARSARQGSRCAPACPCVPGAWARRGRTARPPADPRPPPPPAPSSRAARCPAALRCEALSRKQSTPAAMRARTPSGVAEAGPRVATILTFRGWVVCMESSPLHGRADGGRKERSRAPPIRTIPAPARTIEDRRGGGVSEPTSGGRKL